MMRFDTVRFTLGPRYAAEKEPIDQLARWFSDLHEWGRTAGVPVEARLADQERVKLLREAARRGDSVSAMELLKDGIDVVFDLSSVDHARDAAFELVRRAELHDGKLRFRVSLTRARPIPSTPREVFSMMVEPPSHGLSSVHISIQEGGNCFEGMFIFPASDRGLKQEATQLVSLWDSIGIVTRENNS